jgi:regulator of RNase E activity RraA
LKDKLTDQLSKLTTPHLADGCLRTGVPIRFAPAGMKPLTANMQCAGRARPVRHVGSIDIFLEVFEQAEPGEVLVIDNGGRLDEACIGDIILLEAKAVGLTGIVIWGLHRDSKELGEIGFPVFSLGALPTGPQRLLARPPDIFSRAAIGPHAIVTADFVVADANGVLFLPEDRLAEIVAAATLYRETEARQLKAMKEGRSYRAQTRFKEYLARREREPGYGFRQHLKDIEAAGEV